MLQNLTKYHDIINTVKFLGTIRLNKIDNKTIAYKSFCPILINGYRVNGLIDSGNLTSNVISAGFARKIGISAEDILPIPDFKEIQTAKGGAPLKVLGRPKRRIQLSFGLNVRQLPFPCVIVEGINMECNIGGPYLAEHNIDQIHSEGVLRYKQNKIKMWAHDELQSANLIKTVNTNEHLNGYNPVYLAHLTHVQPHTITRLKVHVPSVMALQLQAGPALLCRHDNFVERTGLLTPKNAVIQLDETGSAYTTVLNPTSQPVKISAHYNMGQVQAIAEPDQHAKTPWRICAKLDLFKAPPVHTRLPHDNAPDLEKKKWITDNFKLNDIALLKDRAKLTKVEDLLLKYFDIFSDGERIGKTKMATHFINTSSDKPISFPPRRVNPKVEQKQNEQIDLWLKQDVIEESDSQYAFPLIPVPKKDGGIRLCVDYRRLNEVTYKDSFPLPNIVDNLDKLAGSTIFSALDNFGAFHSVPIHPADRHKTAFTSPTGLYQFKFMPFGLMNGPPTYSRLIKLVLKNVPLSMAIPYLDDCCVHSKDFDGHLIALEKVFHAYQNAGLTLKPSKCQLFQTSLTYLGHDVSEKGIEISKDYVEIIKTWPSPTTPAEIRTFLGKMGYYRKFIEKFSHISQPLAMYLKDLDPKDEKKSITLSPSAIRAFEVLKLKLQTAPILAYPDFNSGKPFILDTDWSFDHQCIGAVLSQEQQGHERVIAYAARKLRKGEINYSSHKGELLAALEYMKYWKHYLLHSQFMLRTDHEALRWIKTMSEPKGMILRWLETLADFDFIVQYRKGTKHTNADALSRVAHATRLTTDTAESHRLLALLPNQNGIDKTTLQRGQINDPVLSRISVAVETGLQDAERVEIVSGLSEGQQVVSTGAAGLSDGDIVTVLANIPAEPTS